jgi:hypothetical protein
VAAAEIALVRTVLTFVVSSGVSQRIAYSSKPMNHPRLNDEEEHRYFDDDEVAPSGKDSSQGNDQRCGAGLPNFAPSTATFGCSEPNSTTDRPSVQVTVHLNGTLTPSTSR